MSYHHLSCPEGKDEDHDFQHRQSRNLTHPSFHLPLGPNMEPSFPRVQGTNWGLGVDTGSAVINEGGAYFNEESLSGYSWGPKEHLLETLATPIPQLSQNGKWLENEAGGGWGRGQERGDNWGGGEVVEDVSTWSLDTIRHVALSLDQTSLSDHHQSVWGASTPQTSLLQNDDNHAMASWGATGATASASIPSCNSAESGTSRNPAVSSTPGDEFLGHPGSNPDPGSRQPNRRKKKMYQWEPQEDPQLEKKRLRALKQFRKRQQEEQEERDMRRCLATTTQEVASLRQEVVLRRQRVEALEQQMARALSLFHQKGQTWQTNPDKCQLQPSW